MDDIKVTYTLSCEKCGEPFESVEGFPPVQLCDKCSKPPSNKATEELREKIIDILRPHCKINLPCKKCFADKNREVCIASETADQILKEVDKWLDGEGAKKYRDGCPVAKKYKIYGNFEPLRLEVK